jgi:hypothetical protein
MKLSIKSARPALMALVFSAAISAPAFADQLPNPVVTASSRPYNGSYSATNLFDQANAEFASLGQLAVKAPFTTNVTDGTWVEMDFGAPVQFDRFVMLSRANAVDIVQESRLIVSDDPTFDATDRIFTFNPSGSNGRGIIQNLYSPVSGRYVRWEVTAGVGSNLGASQMWFLKTPQGQSLLPAPAVLDAYEAYNDTTYAAGNAVNGDYGSEYASLGAAETAYIDFDFGGAKQISGFEYLNRWSDRLTNFDLIFSDTPDFSAPTKTLSFSASPNGNMVNAETFDPVTAQYVRLQGTAFDGAVNTGAREIQFFTPGTLPPLITQSPTGGTRLAGDTFTLASAAAGGIPLNFQWRLNGSAIAGATNASLTLTNVQVSNSGSYDVVISNSSGSVTSAPPSVLTVIDPALDITSNLELWLKLDETAGLTAADASGNHRDGALTGFIGDDSQWTNGRIQGAIQLNSTNHIDDERVMIAQDGGLDFSTNLEFTIAAWVNGAATQESGAGVVANGTGAGGEQYALDIYNNAYRLYVRDTNGAAVNLNTTIHPNGTWQHIAAVFSAPLNRMKFYLNGAEVASATPPSSLLQNFSDVSIGSRQSGGDAYDFNFSGTLDDVRIYRRALTSRDVAEIYNQASLVAPTIVTAPAGGDFLALENLTLSVVADGSLPLTYQWKLGGADIANATNSTLTLTNLAAANAGSYTVVVRNAVGSITSSEAKVTVNDPAPALDQGLVLYLKFDETSGTDAADSSGLNHPGVLQDFDGDPWTPGILGNAINFNPDGADGNDVVLVQDDGTLDFSSTLEFSITAWVNGDPLQEAGGPIICKGDGGGGEQYAIDMANGFRFYGWLGDAPGTYNLSAPISPNNTWQHVAAVFSRPRNRLKLYINGVEMASGVPPEMIVQNFHEVSIGSRQNAGSDAYDLNFKGKIDDVRIYNRPLTPREVKTLSQTGTPPQVTIARSGGTITISWPSDLAGFTLESAAALPAGTWTPVSGVANNQVQITPTGAPQFFRLRK